MNDSEKGPRLETGALSENDAAKRQGQNSALAADSFSRANETLSADHRAFLNGQAITDATLAEFGVRSVTAAEAREIGFDAWHVNGSDGILFRWPVPGAEPVPQFCPDDPAVQDNGKPAKYVFLKGTGSVLGIFREAREGCPYLFPEGTKQSLAVASYAPEGWGVVGTPGCRTWYGSDLEWAEGHEVIAMFDKDTATNADVWDAAKELQGALDLADAAGTRFARLSGARDKDGMDDVLGRKAEDKRADLITRLADKATDKLGHRPSEKRSGPAETPPPDTGGRVGVAVNRDRQEVIGKILGAVREKWDGTRLFNFGDAIAWLDKSALRPVEKGTFLKLLTDAVAAYHYVPATHTQPARYDPAWPDTQTVAAVLSCAEEFVPLQRIMRAPYVRRDGTVCAESGYDAASQTWLEMAEGLEISVPDDPTAEETESARKYLMEELLGDFPFDSDADRAGALALLLTPFIRDRIDLAPMAVVDGNGMGVGKNLFADVVSIIVYGNTAETRPLSGDNEEIRKTLVSVLRQGESLVVFDEAHVLQGNALAQVLTAEWWKDRVLGVSDDVKLPNKATWVALGNNVAVNGDITRRVYWVRIAPAYANPQDRPASSFRHPELKDWAAEHRSDLLNAVLTLIRAWYAAGCPWQPGAETFGSFGKWEQTVGGILQTAGQPGFLEGLRTKREESDYTGSLWGEHLAWLVGVFGPEGFSTADVKARATGADAFTRRFASPPGLEDTSAKDWTRSLGYAYRGAVGRNRSGLTLIRLERAHNNTAKYAVKIDESGGDGGDGGDGYPMRTRKTHREIDDHVSQYGSGETGREVSPPSPPSPPDLVDALPESPCSCPPAESQDPFLPPCGHWESCLNYAPLSGGS